tara:strand:+ start:256 stop:600 length:345 start_codon:yes stop_codon:yes gene_type:complete
MKKLLLILLCLPLLFSSCQKCQECASAQSTQEVLSGYEQSIIGYEQIIIGYWPDGWPMYANGDPIYEDQAVYVTYPTPFEEVCRDNFNSKQDYDEYIKVLEDELGYTCQSDFWN